jgi:methyl-accepting chemotaxis protein
MTQSTSEKILIEKSKPAGDIFRVAAIVLGAALAVLFFYLFLSWQLGAWQMLALTGFIAVFVVDTVLAMRLIRGGNPNSGSWMIVIGVIAVFPIATLLIAKIGVIFGIVLFILTFSIASQTLSTRQARRANMIGLGAGILTALLEFLPLNYRLVVPEIQTFVPAITAVMVVVMIFFAVRQSWDSILNFIQASIRNRLIAIVIGAAIIPVVLISIFLGWVTYVQVRNALTQDAFDKLAAVQQIKANQIASYMVERRSDMASLGETMSTLSNEAFVKLSAVNTLKKSGITRQFQVWDADVRDVASDPGIVTGVMDLTTGFNTLGADEARALYLGNAKLESAGEGSAYSSAHQEQHGFFTGYIAIHGYEDAFLVDPAGNIVYSVSKGDGFGSSLVNGDYKSSNFAALYKALKNAPAGETYIADVGNFENGLHLFIGTPIYNGSNFVGILAYQLPLAQIDTIMAEKTGLGLTSETFLVALEADGRYTMRNTRSSLGPEFVIGTDVSDRTPKFVRDALAGKTGNALSIGGAGEAVAASYEPMGIKGFNWAIISKIGAEEALSPTHAGAEKDYLTLYTEEYGYYDLFLISPDGYIFYSVAKEADYKTNILTGEYNSTNLGAMISQVIKSKGLEFADFAAYAPSGGKPAAFFGIPVLDENNNIQMIVAAQASQAQLNAVMAEDTGLGETGETFIVGEDKLRRTETRFLTALGVESTILNPDFKVDTVATRSALAGESGQATFTDFRGLGVLGVWSPLEVNAPDATHPNGQIWAVIAKLDESEALAPVNALAGTLGLIIGLAVMFVGALAVFIGTRFATGFVVPILNLTDTATQVTAGNMNLTVKTESKDEIGTLSNAFNTMTAQLRDLIGSLEGRVAARTKDLATVAEVGTATATILETDKLLQEVVNLSKERFGLYHSHIYLLDEAGENLVLASGAGEAGRQMKAKGLSIPLNREQSLVARAAREQKGVTVNDVTQEPDFLPNPLLPDTRSELAVPMIIGGKVIGVFDVQSDQVGRFTESDISIQTTLAAQVSTSIQNVRSFEQSKAQADLESLINSIGQKIQRATTVDDTLQTAIREIGVALGASRVSANIGIRQQNDDHHAGNN